MMNHQDGTVGGDHARCAKLNARLHGDAQRNWDNEYSHELKKWAFKRGRANLSQRMGSEAWWSAEMASFVQDQTIKCRSTSL